MQKTKKEVATQYLTFLASADSTQLITLFTSDSMVVSPLYGTMPATTFYTNLFNDTTTSVLKVDGIFYEEDSNRISLLFDYHWELANGKVVDFKVVDIIELDTLLYIQKLTIIYDTVHSRTALEDLRNSI